MISMLTEMLSTLCVFPMSTVAEHGSTTTAASGLFPILVSVGMHHLHMACPTAKAAQVSVWCISRFRGGTSLMTSLLLNGILLRQMLRALGAITRALALLSVSMMMGSIIHILTSPQITI